MAGVLTLCRLTWCTPLFKILQWRRRSAKITSRYSYLSMWWSVLFMMAKAIPNFELFGTHADGAIARWWKWIKHLENLFVAADISDEKRQRSLLLYNAREKLLEISDTLPATGEGCETAETKLNAYFDPKKNVKFELYRFRQAKQNPGETTNSYHSRSDSWQMWRYLASGLCTSSYQRCTCFRLHLLITTIAHCDLCSDSRHVNRVKESVVFTVAIAWCQK